ncbi:MAG TPA: hypothetical protein VN832_05560 [Stellaceae bacterium]|nr:hypothetical protein [Stellaceae bacterium]
MPTKISWSGALALDPASFVFQAAPTDMINTEAIAQYMKKYGMKKIGVVAATDASGEVGVTSVKTVFPAAGIQYKLDRIDFASRDGVCRDNFDLDCRRFRRKPR